MEHLKTRAEHSRSLEDADKYRALHTLTELGMLVPLSDLDLYHGRSAKPGESLEDWGVNPDFSNASNDSGNNNINKRSTLYTAPGPVANKFASARVARGGDAQLQRIESDDPEARVLNIWFNRDQLEGEDQKRFDEALESLVLKVTEGSPVDFEDRDKVKPFIEEVDARQGNHRIIDTETAKSVSAAQGMGRQSALRLAGGLNSRYFMTKDPAYMVRRYISGSEDLITEDFKDKDGKTTNWPLNMEYVQKWLRDAHVIGIRMHVNSATLGEQVETFPLFDLEKANSDIRLREDKAYTNRMVGHMAIFLRLGNPNNIQDLPDVARQIIENPYAKPKNLVDAAMEVEGFREIFEGDSGVWEGYSLAEHTETVLENFDNNYADIVPASLVGPMRLALLAHDIGKSVAAREGRKKDQKEYNDRYAAEFYKKIGLSQRDSAMLRSMIGKGMELAEGVFYKGTDEERAAKKAEFYRHAKNVLTSSTSTPERVTKSMIIGYMSMVKALLVCDGGAYTSMATTRNRSTKRMGVYRNAPSFNKTFGAPTDLGSRGLRLRHKGASHAPGAHFKYPTGPASRLRTPMNSRNKPRVN